MSLVYKNILEKQDALIEEIDESFLKSDEF